MKKVKLTSVCRPKQWKTIPTSELRDVGYPVYGANGVIGYYDSYNHEQETVVITCRGATCGTVNLTHPRSYVTGNAMCLDNVDDSVNVRYLFYSMQAYDFKKVISGTAQPQITREGLEKVEFVLHSLDMQKKMVRILDETDTLIEKRRVQLEKLDELVKSRFIELFGDPVSNPKGWDKEELFQCLTSIDNGKSFVCEANSRTGDAPAVLKLSAATYGYYKPEENKAMIDVEQFVENAEVHSGDLLFTRKNTPDLVGMCAYVYDTPVKLMMPDLIFRLNVSERCDKIFLWKLINHDLFRPCIENIVTGSAKSMSNISKERLLRLKIILPPLELQQQFSAFVAQVDKSKFVVQKSLQELETLKKSLMQQYFG